MKLIQLIAQRAKSHGIRLAGDYLREIQTCLADGTCPAKIFELAEQATWESAVKSADGRLTYSDHENVVLGSYGAEAIKAAKTSEGVTPLVVFEGVSTSRRKDRDRDIMEPKGATVDMAHPLLWQHMPFQPLGKHLDVTKQTEQQIANKWAIYDVGNGLGADAAKLVEVQALRLSIGFDVEAYDQLKDGRFHVKEFEIVETSLVSVPSNVDAIITLYSREKLYHPAVKGWAKSLHDGRPAAVKSGIEFGEDGKVQAGASAAGDCKCKGGPAGTRCGDNAVPAATTPQADTASQDSQQDPQQKQHATDQQKMYLGAGAFVGSYEWTRWKLQQAVRDYLKLSKDGYAYIEYTYSDHAIVCVCDREKGGDYREYFVKVGWAMVDGEPTWVGESKEVELDIVVKPVDTEKRRAEKAGRAISRKNESALQESREQMEQAIKAIRLADSKVSTVISESGGNGDGGGDDEDDDDSPHEEKIRKAGEVVMAAGVEDLSHLRTLKQVTDLAIEALEAEEMEALFEADN